jgi:sugar lactone lactonase YvrE
VDQASVVAGGSVTLSASASSSGANVGSFYARIDVTDGSQGVFSDGSYWHWFPAGTATASGSIGWTSPSAPGSYVLSVTASNCFGAAAATVTITVGPVPVALPVVDSLGGSATSLLAGKTVTLTASAHDPAGGAITYGWSAPGGTFSAPAAASTTWTAPATGGQYLITVTVASAQGTTSASLPLTVNLADYQGSFGYASRAPRRVAIGPSGEFFVVDGKTGAIVRMTPSGKPVGPLQVPERMLAITWGKGVLYATSTSGGLYAIDPLGGPPRAIPLRDGALRMPSGVAFDAGRGILWIAEGAGNQLRGVRLDGSTAFAPSMAGSTPLSSPEDVGFDPVSGTVWVSLGGNEGGSTLHAFDGATGNYLYSAAPYGTADGQVTRAGGLAVDGAGRVFVSDVFQGRVQVFQRTGAPAGSVGQYGVGAGHLAMPKGVATAADGTVLVASMDQGRVERFGTGSVPPPQTCTVNGQLDSDCDGLPDWWELKYGLNPYWAGDALLDPDGDGLTNLQEYQLGTNPLVANGLPGTGGAPVLTVPSPKTSDPGLVRFGTTVASSTSCTVSWKQRLGPAVTLRGADSLTPSFVGRVAGRYQFQGTASCGGQLATGVIEATIRNVAPRADAGRLVVAHAGSRIALDGRFSSDANGDAVALAWDQTSGTPLSGAAPGASLPLQLHQPGYAAFQLTATDPAGKSGTAEVPIFAVSSAAAPTAVAESPVVAATGVPVTLDATSSVYPPGTAAFQWAQVAGPAVTLSAPGSATPSFTPPSAGRYAFQVRVAAGAVRSPPALVEVYAGPGGALPVAAATQGALQATAGEPLALDGSASTAAAGGSLQFSWRQVSGPAAGLTDADRALATVVPFGPGVYAFELTVTENGASSQPARVVVTATSTAAGQGIPVARAVAPAAGVVGTSLSLDGTGSYDPDGHWLRHRWTQLAGPWVALDDPGSSNPSFRPPAPGTYVFELEVDDLKIRSAAAAVRVTVAAPGVTP